LDNLGGQTITLGAQLSWSPIESTWNLDEGAPAVAQTGMVRQFAQSSEGR
jgi:hypothetical protein